MFCHIYPGLDPNEETVARFYGLLNRVPDDVKIAWGYGGDTSLEETAERMEREGAKVSAWENLTG
jgi:hypothetical protein